MVNCIYHPNYPMRVVNDDEYQRLLKTGEWFKHPTDAQKFKESQNELLEKQRLHSQRRERGRNIKQSSKDGGISTS